MINPLIALQAGNIAVDPSKGLNQLANAIQTKDARTKGS